jgi:hypothetical protein
VTLSPADAKDFFRLSRKLDTFFQSRLRLPEIDGSPESIRRLRDAGFADPDHVAAYAETNPDKLGPADLDTVRSWRQHGLAGRFFVHKERKDGCIYSSTVTDPSTLYLVTGLTQPIGELLPFFPCYVEARLLPYRGQIVIDGVIAPIMIRLGPGMRSRFDEEMKRTLATRGLVTTLPAPAAPSAPDPAALLKHYLSTAANRRDYAPEIQALRRQTRALHIQYLQETGKLHSKSLKANLKAKGITEGWFAVIEDTIVTGAADKEQAAAAAAQLVPPELRDGMVWFRM